MDEKVDISLTLDECAYLAKVLAAVMDGVVPPYSSVARDIQRRLENITPPPCKAGDRIVFRNRYDHQPTWMGCVSSVERVAGEWRLGGKFVTQTMESEVLYVWNGGPKVEVL